MNNPGNFFAIIALVAWFPITFLLFARYKPALATALSIVGGNLFLPELVQINLPVFPDLTKSSIPALAVLMACSFKARSRLSQAKPLTGIDLCIVLVVIQDIGTWLTNPDPVPGGPLPRPGLTAYDFVNELCAHLLLIYGVFFIGRALFTRAEDVIALLRVMFGLSMVYAVGCLIEIKFSPQMHNWIYGFMQHDFAQMIRGGGFRPMLFMSHGITLARYMAVALLAGLTLWRLNMVKGKTAFGLACTVVVFFLCKSTGAIVLFILFAPFCVFAAAKSQARLAFSLMMFVALYPLLRGADWVPVEKMLEMAADVSQERAESLATRFDNEGELLERVRQRIWFGWGGYSREAIYDEYNHNLTIVDGEWIGVFSTGGIVGFVGHYGFYLLPIFFAARRIRSITTPEYALLLGGLMLITTLLVFDTLPNASLSLPTYFWAGALAGATPGLVREDAQRRQRIRERRAKRVAAALDPAAAEPVGAMPNAV